MLAVHSGPRSAGRLIHFPNLKRPRLFRKWRWRLNWISSGRWRGLLWLRLARRLLNAGIPNSSRKQTFRMYHGITLELEISMGRHTRNRWEGSLGQQQCRTTVTNGSITWLEWLWP